MLYSFLTIPTLLAAAFLIPLISLKEGRFIPYVAMSGSLVSLFFAFITVPMVMEHGVLTTQMEEWPAPFGITLAVDSFSMLLIIIVTLIGFFALLFSLRFIKEKKTEYYSLTCLLLAGLLGAAHTGDMFNLFVFFEIMSISSYLLTAYYRKAESIEGSIKYLLMGSLGTSLILFGVAFLYGAAGTLNMADLAVQLQGLEGYIVPIALGLLLTGFGFKAAIFPFHAWKPDAISVTPVPIAAIFSTASTAVGIYTIFRIFTLLPIGSVFIHSLLVVIGVLTMIVGAVLAMQQNKLMRLLAYSSISQAGFVLLAFGTGIFNPLGYTAAVFHLFNIVIFEALLFFVAGVIIHETGTQDMRKLGGFARFSPVLSYAFLIGILANIGIPLLSGFSSKWLIYISTLKSFPVLTLVAVVVSVLTMTYSLKAYNLIFLGNVNIKPRAISRSMLVPIIILAAIVIFFGVLPQIGIEISEFIVRSFDNSLYISRVLI